MTIQVKEIDLTGKEEHTHREILENGILFTKSDKKYRLIGKDLLTGFIYYCNIEGSLEFNLLSYSSFLDYVKNKEIKILEETIPYPDDDLISEEERELVLKKERAMLKIIDIYGPSFIGLKETCNKEEIKLLASECKMSYDSFRRLINRYIKSGFKKYSLYAKNSKAFSNKRPTYLYQNKPGRKRYDDRKSGIIITEEIKKVFDVYIGIYLSSNKLTLRNVYNQMNEDYFKEETPNKAIKILKPINERPTYNQFKYYFYSNPQLKEKLKKRSGTRIFRNNSRKLVSDTLINTMGPGDRVEIDAWEVPFAILDNSKTKVLGKPVLYAMVDCYTKMVLAASLSFENNSYIGLTSLFLNMTLEKRDDEILNEEILSSYNICNVPGILPREIVSDRGSDFISKDFEKVLDRIHITHNIAPAATGSYKGNVEQLFNQLDLAMKPHLLNNGYITKDYGESPYKDARLTLNGLARIIHNTIVKRNISLFENFTPTKDMIDKNIYLSPVSLWEYGIEESLSNPRTIHDPIQYAYDLMIENKAYVGRKGIKYKGLYYDCKKDPILQDQIFNSSGLKMKIRTDPRDNSSVFYKRDGKIYEAKLNLNISSNASFNNLTWYEYDKYKKEIAKIKTNNRDFNDNMHVIYNESINQVVNEEKDTKNKINTINNIRENRKIAKENHAIENSIKNKVGINEENNIIYQDVAYEEIENNDKTSKDIEKENFLSALESLE